MAIRLNYLRQRIPQLPRLDGVPGPLQDYLRQLSTALQEWDRNSLRAIHELDNPPFFAAALITTSQSISTNTLTTVQLNSTIVDTQGWWDGTTHTYTPKEPGFYRCSWMVNLHDTAAIATTTYGLSSLNNHEVIQYGNGSAQVVDVGGSTIIESNGSTTAITLQAKLLAGTAATVVAASPYRTWLTIDYLGRKAL